MIRHRGIEVDVRGSRISFGARSVKLEPAIARLAAALVANGGHVVSFGVIEDALWRHREDGGPNDTLGTLAVYAYRLRAALQSIGSGAEVDSLYGRGYMLAFHEAQRHAA